MARHARKRTGRGGGGSNLAWFVGGLLLGVASAAVFFRQGVIPGMPERTEVRETAPPAGEPGLLDDAGESGPDSRFDFFTVLPEMEVVVPERELAQPAASEASAADAGSESYVLQVGSFRSAADADEMKARLALLGSVARVQTVTVDQQTWHRVRVGPVNGSREANSLRRRLQDNGIDVLVLKGTD